MVGVYDWGIELGGKLDGGCADGMGVGVQVWGKTGSKLYGKKSGSDFNDNQKRFRLFCEAAIEATRVLPFGPGEQCTFIANDWHAGLVPVLLKVLLLIWLLRLRNCPVSVCDFLWPELLGK